MAQKKKEDKTKILKKEKSKIIMTTELGDKGTWEGVIKSVIYMGEKNYSIINLILKNNTEIIAEGTIPNPRKNAFIRITGTVVHNETYNSNQIQVTACDLKVSPEIMSAIAFIHSDAIPGFTTFKVASEFVDFFGPSVPDYITDVKKLMTYPRITEKRAMAIKKAYEENEMLYPLYQVTGGRITYNQAKKIYEKYKEQSADAIKRNPYQLVYDISGIGFASADDLALHMGFKYDSKERILAALVFIINDAATSNGHTYLPTSKVLKDTEDLVFSLRELKNVYYQDALLMKGIPDDLTDWETTQLCELVKASNRKNSIINKILDNWGENEARDAYCSKYDFSMEEIDTIDSFYTKRQNFMPLIKEVLDKASFDGRKLSATEIIDELYDVQNRGCLLVRAKGKCNEDAVFLKYFFKAEYEIAQTLCEKMEQGVVRTISDKLIDGAIAIIEKSEGQKINKPYKLDESQKEGVRTALRNRVSVITGGPGCGKTTIIKTAIAAWHASSPKNRDSNNPAEILLLAPTGRAAKRMTESTGYPAKTIHRFLLGNGVKFTSLNGNGGSIDCIKNDDTLIFVDETSMVDINLARKLIACTKRAQICFVGDVDQLPSVGAGLFLEDIIKSTKIPCVYLTSCHRNSGSILDNSRRINHGAPIYELVNDINFKTLWLKESDVIKKNVIDLYLGLRKKYDAKDVVILTPMRERATGINTFNEIIQNAINPPSPTKKEMKTGKSTFRVGDRVMQTKNDYERYVTINGTETTGVFNGDLGTIIDFYIDEDDNLFCVVQFDDGGVAKYTLSDLKHSTLELAYAMTYYKSQGSEFKAVICVLTTADFMLLKKKMLFTGVSRAKDLCVCIGMSKAFTMAIKDYGGDHTHRNTMLEKRLCQLSENLKHSDDLEYSESSDNSELYTA